MNNDARCAASSYLQNYLVVPLKQRLGETLDRYAYHDIGDESQCTTNGSSIDIVTQQLEIEFSNLPPLFFSWTDTACWEQYSIGVSEQPYCVGADKYTGINANWKALIGSKLIGFDIYGYQQYAVEATAINGESVVENFYLQPQC